MQYAKDTNVSVEKSRAEIEATVSRYGARSFASGWVTGRASIQFEMKNRRLRFILPLPDRNEKRFTHYRHSSGREMARDPIQAAKQWEQGCRQAWRALALLIKAKLEAVEGQISEFDHEFLSNVVMPNGMTVAEMILPDLSRALETGHLPPLLPGPEC